MVLPKSPHNDDATPAADKNAQAPSLPVNAGLSQIASQNFDAKAAVGGWRGITESVLPVVVFIGALALSGQNLKVAVIAALMVSGVAIVARLCQRQSLLQALAGGAITIISAALAWYNQDAGQFYAMGLLVNVVWLAVVLISMPMRYPLVGVIVAVVTGCGMDWRKQPGERRRRYYLATWLLAGMFSLRLVVEVPLYLAGASALTALSIARLALGTPLFLLAVWLIWLLVQGIDRTSR